MYLDKSDGSVPKKVSGLSKSVFRKQETRKGKKKRISFFFLYAGHIKDDKSYINILQKYYKRITKISQKFHKNFTQIGQKGGGK